MDIISLQDSWFDETIDDAFAYRSKKLLQRIKQKEIDAEIREAA